MTERSNQWLRKVDAFIDAHIGDANLSVGQIAAAVYSSERQFYRRIRLLTGMTPNEYLQRKRLSRARDILHGKMPSSVAALASAVGYIRSDYFSQLYQKAYGHRPAELL